VVAVPLTHIVSSPFFLGNSSSQTQFGEFGEVLSVFLEDGEDFDVYTEGFENGVED
jgi:hypothetical protein